MTARTNAQVLATKQALEWLGNQAKGEKAKASLYNALMLRLNNAVLAFTPMTDALVATQRQMLDRYKKEAGEDFKVKDDGSFTFGAELDAQYQAEYKELVNAPAEDEPRRRAFRLADFDAVGISVPQAIMAQLGPLLELPDEDEDAKTDKDGEAAEDGE